VLAKCVSVPDEVVGLIVRRSFEQIHKVGLVLRDEFGKSCAEPLSEAVRRCFE